jgi:hypothetical protein
MATESNQTVGYINIVKNLQVQPFQMFITNKDLAQHTEANRKIREAYLNLNITELLFDMRNMPTKVIKIDRKKYNTFEKFLVSSLGILANIHPTQINIDGVTTLCESHSDMLAAVEQRQFAHVRSANRSSVDALAITAKTSPIHFTHPVMGKKFLLDITNTSQHITYDKDRNAYYAKYHLSPHAMNPKVKFTTGDNTILSVKAHYNKGSGKIYFDVDRLDTTKPVRDFKVEVFSTNLLTHVYVKESFEYNS